MKIHRKNTFEAMDAIFHPGSIAVVGATENPGSLGYHYLCYLRDAGYEGKIFPVNPEYKKVHNFRAYPSLKDITEDVDYVICCINAGLVIGMLEQCPQKNVLAVQLFTGRLSETGDPAAQSLEEQILVKAIESGVRLIGPNCMGIYHPAAGISFGYDLPTEPGHVGGIFQSGGIAGECTRFCSFKGLRFSKVISYGNALDLDECHFLEYLSNDPETRVILLYIEGTKNGQRLLYALRRAAQRKPIIVLKGGRGRAGNKAASSHTAAMAGSFDTWEGLFRQCNVVQAANMNEMVDLAAGFSMLPRIKERKVAIVGGGGGKTVLSADESEEAGLFLSPLPLQIRKILEEKEPRLANWMGNPVDFSILPGSSITPAEILDALSEDNQIDIIIGNFTEDNPYDKKHWISWIRDEAEGYLSVAGKGSKPIVVIISNPQIDETGPNKWRWKILAEEKERLLAAGVPVFSSVFSAVTVIDKMASYYTAAG